MSIAEDTAEVVKAVMLTSNRQEIRIQHRTVPHLLSHASWISSADYVDKGSAEPLGFFRIMLSHPEGCTCPP